VEQITPTLMNWASILDQQTRQQAVQTSQMGFIYPHLALMPDAHLGKGATVGSVIPTLGNIIPAAVGVDIGCGMIAVRTQWTDRDISFDKLGRAATFRPLREAIEKVIPLSPGKYNSGLYDSRTRRRVTELENSGGVDSARSVSGHPWHLQLGSLGGGNHFIEVTLDEEDRVWAFLHSGSRGVGNKIAQKHIRIAQQKCQGVTLPNRDLAFLDERTPEFRDYITDLRWAQKFALAGRVHSRGSAKHRFTLEDLQQRMRGIEWRRSDVFLDEHPDAYKDIDVVMADSAELVEAIHEFRQILNVKGE